MPRDPKRIDRVLSLIKAYWYTHPDLRLGQILTNLNPSHGNDVFYFEDNVLEESLKEELKECPFCFGTGNHQGSENGMRPCSQCNGKGKYT